MTGAPLVDEVDEVDERDEVDVGVGIHGVLCEQCRSVMSSDDIFCPECGFVSRSVTRAFTSSDFTGETRQLHFDSLAPPSVEPDGLGRKPVPEPQWDAETETTTAPASYSELISAPPPPAPAPPTPPVTSQPVVAPPASLPPPVLPTTLAPPLVWRATPVAAPTTPPPPATPPPAAPPHHLASRSFIDDDDDVEATRIVNRLTGNRFVLQFSTGESFTVHGTGLIGRNPQPQPGEFFDHLVRVLDTGKSVSKTHLEFGQEEGAFWIKDRFSGNGTIIREPDISARRAEPDRRYRIVRGSRIDIGEQFFVIS